MIRAGITTNTTMIFADTTLEIVPTKRSERVVALDEGGKTTSFRFEDLPFDLCSYIFKLACEDDVLDFSEHRSPRATFAILLQVSKAWREVAMLTPLIFDFRLVIDPTCFRGNQEQRALLKLKKMFSVCGRRLTRLHIGTRLHKANPEIFGFLMGFSERFTSLALEGLQARLVGFEIDMPNLEELFLLTDVSSSRNTPTLQFRFPKLSKLHIYDIHFPISVAKIGLPWHSITHFSYGIRTDSEEGKSACMVGLSEFIGLLPNLPNLTYLHLAHVAIRDWGTNSIATFPRLKTLELHFSYPFDWVFLRVGCSDDTPTHIRPSARDPRSGAREPRSAQYPALDQAH